MAEGELKPKIGVSRREIIPALAGGIAGALSGSIFSAIYQWYSDKKPNLFVRFGNDVPGLIDHVDFIDEGDNKTSVGKLSGFESKLKIEVILPHVMLQ